MFTQKVILNLMSISGRKSFRVRCPFQKRNSFGISYIDVRFKRRSHLVLPRCTFHKRSLLYYPDDLFIKEVFWYQLDVHLKRSILVSARCPFKNHYFLCRRPSRENIIFLATLQIREKTFYLFLLFSVLVRRP